MSAPETDFDPTELRDRIEGEVVMPADPGWRESRLAFNLVADQNPAAIAFAESAADVAAVLEAAAAAGLAVAPQATGHGAPNLPDLGGAILLKTSRMTGVTVDPGARTARVAAGTQWRDVVAAAAEHGLIGLLGFSGTVGVVGYTVGGGLGWLGRSHGLAGNAVRSFEVVTAAGESLTCSASEHADLFWALRGGGGAHAIVTSVEIELFPLESAYAGQLMWPLDRAPEVVEAYREVCATAPEELSTTLGFVRLPPLPQLPEVLRGQSLVTVGSAFTGEAAEGERLLAPLRALGDLHLDTAAEIPAAGLADVAGDPRDPAPGLGGHLMIDRLDDAAVEALLEQVGPGAASPFVNLTLRQLGGALARAPEDAGAADRLEGEFLLFAVGIPVTPEAGQAIGAAHAQLAERMAPHSTGRTSLNFAEGQPGVRGSFPDRVVDRLAEVKRRYDPEDRILANHPID